MALHDAVELAAFHLEPAAAPRAGGEEHGLVALREQRRQRPVGAEALARADLDAEVEDRRDLGVDHGARQTVLGDAQCTIIPPRRSEASNTVTRWPRNARSCAHARPDGPPPATATRPPRPPPGAEPLLQVADVGLALHAGRHRTVEHRREAGCPCSPRRDFSVRKRLMLRIATGSSMAPATTRALAGRRADAAAHRRERVRRRAPRGRPRRTGPCSISVTYVPASVPTGQAVAQGTFAAERARVADVAAGTARRRAPRSRGARRVAAA